MRNTSFIVYSVALVLSIGLAALHVGFILQDGAFLNWFGLVVNAATIWICVRGLEEELR